jgi:hypothetical protein
MKKSKLFNNNNSNPKKKDKLSQKKQKGLGKITQKKKSKHGSKLLHHRNIESMSFNKKITKL